MMVTVLLFRTKSLSIQGISIAINVVRSVQDKRQIPGGKLALSGLSFLNPVGTNPGSATNAYL